MLIRVSSSILIALSIASVAFADWSTYQRDPGHTAYSPETRLSAANAANLTTAWTFRTGGLVSGTPIIAGGAVYAGSWDGKMYALDQIDGRQLWSFDTGTVADSCGNTYGIDSTAAFLDGTLYFGAADCTLYALNAATGELIWRTQLADSTKGFHLWSSPVIFDGRLYVGLASHCDSPCVRGSIVCVSASDGRVLWNFYVAPEGSTGGGVWSSIAVDTSKRLVFATTGNYCEGEDTYSDSIVALDVQYGSLVWVYKNINQDSNDLDFGASPVFFEVNGQPALAAGSKDGHCYALNRETGQLIWNSRVTDGGAEGGIISSPAAAYGMIFMGASVDGDEAGKVVALDQNDGHIVWEAVQSAPVLGPASVGGGVVFIGGADGKVRAYDAMTGTELWSRQTGPAFSGVSISDGRLFAGGGYSVYSFTLATPKIVTESLPDGKVGRVYAATLQASSEQPLAWSIASGVLPPGLALSLAGELAGVPTDPGEFTFVAQASDSDGQIGSANLQITIAPRETITVTSPVDGDKWKIGRRHEVAWSSSAGVSKVDINLSRDGGSTWESLAESVDATPGAILIRAKNPRSDSAIVRVVDSSDSTVIGSSVVFRIR